MTEGELDERYHRIGGFVGFIRKPRLLQSGNIAEFFVGSDSPDADAVLALGASRYQDCEVYVTVHLVKDAVGTPQKKAGGPTASEAKPYGQHAAELYRMGFFNHPVVRAAAGCGGPPHDVAHAIAAVLGYDSMGMVPLRVLREWCERYGCVLALPASYRDCD